MVAGSSAGEPGAARAGGLPWGREHLEVKLLVELEELALRGGGGDPFTYLVDVLQRISVHPASRAVELTPRKWKARFAHDPMKSILAYGKI